MLTNIIRRRPLDETIPPAVQVQSIRRDIFRVEHILETAERHANRIRGVLAGLHHELASIDD